MIENLLEHIKFSETLTTTKTHLSVTHLGDMEVALCLPGTRKVPVSAISIASSRSALGTSALVDFDGKVF